MRLLFLLVSMWSLGFSGFLSAPSAAAVRRGTESLEKAIYRKVNDYRAGEGLRRLRWDDRLAGQAREHSEAMAQGRRGFGHARFSRRIKAAGIEFTSAGENVGQNQGFDDPADQAIEGWLRSPGHRANIEGRYNLTGVGVARSRNGTFFFTQIFMLAPDPGNKSAKPGTLSR